MEPILAAMLTFSFYGFWPPNDPQGSSSDTVWAKHLRPFGPATKANERIYRNRESNQKRQAIKNAYIRPEVKINGHQARAIGRGFATAVSNAEYIILACAIMHDHCHLVVRDNPQRPFKRMARHLKSMATRQLREENHVPTGCEQATPWGEYNNVIYLHSPNEVRRKIQYVEMNPVKAGMKSQIAFWDFVVDYEYFLRTQ